MTSLRCALLGMDARDKYGYEYFFRELCDGKFSAVTDPTVADVLLIDVDTADGRRLALPYMTRPNHRQTLITVSANTAHPDHVVLLHKPFTTEQLRATLNGVLTRHEQAPEAPAPAPAQTLSESAASSARQVAPAALALEDESFNHYLFRFDGGKQAQSQEAFFEPDDYLCGALGRALKLSRARSTMVEIRWDLSPIRVSALERRIHTGLNDKVLRSVAVARGSFELVPLPAGCGWPSDAQPEAFDPLLWRLTAWTSRGRVPQGTDRSAAVQLRRWPNMTRLLPTPHAMQIAALWASAPCTLAETAQRLMTSIGDVQVFYSCATALDLLRTLPVKPEAEYATATLPKAHTPPPAPLQPSRQRGLLNRILAHILPFQNDHERS